MTIDMLRIAKQALVVQLGWIAFLVLTIQPAHAVVWQEPTCDPATDPSTCNIAVPLNVSSSAQTKQGSLTVVGSLTVNNGFSLTAGSFSVPNDSITDAMVSNTLTASVFQRGTGNDPEVELDTNEVTGTLPAGSVTDIWVNTTGDTMTGTLNITPSSTTGIVITPTTTQNGISISGSSSARLLALTSTGNTGGGIGLTLNSTSSGTGLTVTSASTTGGAYPIEVISNGSATRGIYVSTQASAGYGVYVATSGTSSVGVFSAGTLYGLQGQANAGTSSIGVYGTSTAGSGVKGESSATNLYGVYGKATGSEGTGVYGESSQGYAIAANSTSSNASHYGLISCKNGQNCGSLGGLNLAGYFQYDTLTTHQSIADRFLPTQPETFGYMSYNDGTKISELFSTGNPWSDVEYMNTDGDELWIFNNHISGNPSIHRVDTATGKEIIEKPFGVYPAYGATLIPQGLVFVQYTTGSMYIWNKHQGSPALLTSTGASSKTNINRLFYDGTYYWGGKTGSLGIDRINVTSFADSLTTFSAGTGVGGWGTIIDFAKDNQYIYALSDSNVASSTSDAKIMRINPGTNIVDKEWVLTGKQVERLLFDGRYLWATVSAPQDGVYRLDLAQTSPSPVLLDFGASYTSFTDPADMAFDGTFIWVGLKGSDTLARFSPFQEDTTPKIYLDTFIATAQDPHQLVFDGESMWILFDGNSSTGIANPLGKYSTGKGYGYQSDEIMLRSGISMYDYSTQAPVCVRVVAGTLTVVGGGFCP